MICKIATITHSKNALDYCEKGGELIHSEGVYGSSKQINNQFKDVHALKPKIKEKSVHAIISFNPKDRALNKGEMIEIAEKYAKQHGFDKNQYAVYLHEDKKHKHLHIVANRIGYDRKVVSSSHSFAKNTEFSKNMEKEYSLVKTNRKEKGKDFVHQKEFSGIMKTMIDECLKRSKNIDELAKNLKNVYSVTMYKGRGVSFMHQEMGDKAIKLKGSEVGREYSLKGLEKQIQDIHFPKKIEATKEFADWYKDFKAENTAVKPTTTRETTSNNLDLNIDQHISSSKGNENFEDDDLIKKRKKRRNMGGMNR